MTKHLLWPSAALSLFAGCLLEVTPEPSPPPPPPPPGFVADLEGQVIDASGGPAPFVPVRLGSQGGPIVATDENGAFVFPAVEGGPQTVYAFDRFAQHVAVADVAVAPGSEDVVLQLESCTDALNGGGSSDPEVITLCFSDVGIDLRPDTPDVTLGAVALSGGIGDTNPYNTATHLAVGSGAVREVFFSMHDGIARGGVREFTIVNHRLEGADPGSDRFGEPFFHITTQDTNGHQRYTVRDGVFQLQVAEGDGPTRSYVLTGTSLVLDYGEPLGPFDPAYTLAMPSLRLEGTLAVDMPPPAPAGDLALDLEISFSFAEYAAGGEILKLNVFGSEQESVGISIDTEQLELPGTVTVEVPLGDAPDLASGNTLRIHSADGASFWDFQLVSYTVTTEAAELPGCGEIFSLTLEDVVFRFVGWDYDASSDRVDSFGDQTLTIDRVELEAMIIPSGAC